MSDIAILIVATALFGITAIAAWAFIHSRRQRLVEFAVGERERTLASILERFRELPELTAFVQSREAQALFATMDAPAAIARRLLAMTGLGLVLLALGMGTWINALGVAHETDINFIRQAPNERWWGTLLLAAGAGLLIAAAACTRLARRWGIFGA